MIIWTAEEKRTRERAHQHIRDILKKKYGAGWNE